MQSVEHLCSIYQISTDSGPSATAGLLVKVDAVELGFRSAIAKGRYSQGYRRLTLTLTLTLGYSGPWL